MTPTPTDPREEVKVTWINCPVCDCPDVRRTESKDGDALIFCTNHACRSNGGKSDAINSNLAAEVERQNVILLSHSKAVGEFACGAPSVPDALRKLAADLKNALDGQEYYKNEADVAAERLAKLAAEVERLKTACEKEFQSVEQLSGENMKLAAENAAWREYYVAGVALDDLDYTHPNHAEAVARVVKATEALTPLSDGTIEQELKNAREWTERETRDREAHQTELATLRTELETAKRTLFQTEKRLDDKLRTALAELEAARKELSRWKKSFDGHVYIEDSKYAQLCADRDTALAAKDAAEKAVKVRDDLLTSAMGVIAAHGPNELWEAIRDLPALTPAPTQEPPSTAILRKLVEWDKEHPKGRIYPIGPNDAEKQLDAIVAEAAAILPPAGGVAISNESSGVEGHAAKASEPSNQHGVNEASASTAGVTVSACSSEGETSPTLTPSNSPADVPSEGLGELLPFNLLDAIDGKAVVTRHGQRVRYDDCVNGVVFGWIGDCRLMWWKNDLFMLPTEGSGA